MAHFVASKTVTNMMASNLAERRLRRLVRFASSTDRWRDVGGLRIAGRGVPGY
jgi:hypothetical protein